MSQGNGGGVANYRYNKPIFLYWLLVFLQIPLTGLFFKNNQFIGSVVFGGIDVAAFLYFWLLVKGAAENYRINRLWFFPVIVYSIWCFLSIFWSVSTSPIFDISLLLRDVIRSVLIYFMLKRVGPEIAWVSFLRSAAIAACGYALLSIFNLDFSDEFSGIGRYSYESYKDSVGVSRQAAILAILSAGVFFANVIPRKYSVIGFLGCIIVCALAFSKAVSISLFLALFIGFSLYKTRLFNFIKTVAFVALIGLVIIIYRWDYITEYIYAPSGLEVMSGRSLIWEEIKGLVMDHPLIGYGLNPVFTLLDGLFYKTPGTAHNEILQQIISYGLVGLMLCFAMYFSYFKAFLLCRNILLSRIMLALFIFFITLGLTESVLVLSVFPIYYIVLFMTLGLYTQRRCSTR